MPFQLNGNDGMVPSAERLSSNWLFYVASGVSQEKIKKGSKIIVHDTWPLTISLLRCWLNTIFDVDSTNSEQMNAIWRLDANFLHHYRLP